MIEAALSDGTSLQFPEGTPDHVIDAAVKSHVASQRQPAPSGPLGGLPQSVSGQIYSTGHVGEAIAEGYRTAPKPYSQEELENANKTWFGYAINNPLMQAANLAVAGGAGLFRGGQQFVQEALSPFSPQLGRDVAAMPEAFFGSPGGLHPILPESGLPGYIHNQMTPGKPPFVLQPDQARFVQEYYGEPVPGGPPPLPKALPAPPTPLLLAAPERPPPPPEAPPPTSSGWAPVVAAGRGETPQTRFNPITGQYETEQSAAAPGARPAEPPVPRPAPPPEAQPAAARAEPAPAQPEPVGGAAGAQRTTEPIPELTKTQTQDAFEKSVLQTAEDRAGPQMVDHTPYVTDSQGNPAQRTEAAREFSEEASAHEKALGDADPAFKQRNREIQDENNRIVFDDYKRQAGDNHAVDEAVKARDRYSPDELGVFNKETPTGMGQSIVDYFNRLLQTPEGKRKAVRSIVEDARDGFLDKDGNPETMPSMLYGGRKNLTDILNEGLGSSTSTRKGSVQAARKFLTDALNDHVDPAIKDGAPLFGEFLTKWHELSKPIDRMEFLQQHLFGPGDVKGVDGKIQFQAVQNLLEKMVKLRRSPGNNPAKSFDLEHLDPLVAIRNELAAWHLRDRLGRTAGSDTNQRAQAAATLKAGPLGQAISGAADVVGHGAAYSTMGPLGPVAYQGVGRPIVQRILKRPGEKKLEAVKQRMLETTPRNQLLLGPPGS